MSTPPPGPDELAAPALRRALRVEQLRRQALEQENARLRDALGRQNARLAALETANQALLAQGREAAAQVGALLAQVQTLTGEVAALREENAQLRAERGEEQPGASTRRPPTWAKAKAPKPATQRERKRRAAEHNHGRRRLPATAVTRTVEHAVATCPHCQTALEGGRAARRVQVIDLPPPPPVEVVEHVLIERRCPHCRRRVRPAAPGDAAGRLGQCRFGPRLVAALAVWRTLERLPIRQLQARLGREHGLALSRGGIMRLLHLAAQQAAPAYAQIRTQVQASPVIHLDETSWREDGQHGYVWVATTPDACLFHRDPSRSGQVVDALLGAQTERAFVTDFSAAYDHCPEQHQRCWAHLWRAIDELQAQHPQDLTLAAWVEAIRAIWHAAAAPRPAAEDGEGRAARRARFARARRYERQILACCPADLPVDRPHAVLAARLRRYLDDLFTFVRDPAVPPTNNLAERRLRPLVIGRKISGGTRSKAGSDDRMILASVLQTALLRGEDPYQTCFAFLATPSPPASP